MTQGNGAVSLGVSNGPPSKSPNTDIELQNVALKLAKAQDELKTTTLTIGGDKDDVSDKVSMGNASDTATIEVSEITARAERDELPKFFTGGGDDDSINIRRTPEKPKLSRANAVSDMIGILRPPSPTGSTVSVMTTTLDVEPNGQLKKANRFLRWNLLFTVIIFVALSMPIWIALIPKVKLVAFEIVVLLVALLQIIWGIASINAIRMLIRLRREHSRGNKVAAMESGDRKDSKGSHFTFKRNRLVKHLVGICMYKEPLEVLQHTVDSLARQAEATEKISVVIGFEEGTPDKDMKTAQLHEMYDDKFERFMVAIHPRGVPGEIPGKCSNFNYCSRTAIKALKKDFTFGLSTMKSELVVTTGDCDSVFPLRYFDLLETDYLYLSEYERHRTVWQSPLFYCMNLDKSPFFVRVVGLMRAFFMMGFLIPWNINTMSIFSMSMKLYEDGKYTHPGYQMDDIIALIRWMLAVRTECTIRCLPVATISGPTSGANYWNELQEWARQIRRWTIGAAEVFHYFAIKSTRLPPLVAISWAIKFITYYGLLLCVAPIFGIIAPPIVEALLNATEEGGATGLLIKEAHVFNYIMLGMLLLQYFWFAIVFLINRLAEPVFPDGLKDETGYIRSFFHYIMALPTIVGYCLVELYAFLEVSVRGKSVCQHVPSKKDGLSNVPSMASIRPSGSNVNIPSMQRSVSQVNVANVNNPSK
uniref:Uncharacterized protein n=1 Tax=Plectus sambesii TaxID=2011161 RepID=A0A914XKX4_9BILA